MKIKRYLLKLRLNHFLCNPYSRFTRVPGVRRHLAESLMTDFRPEVITYTLMWSLSF